LRRVIGKIKHNDLDCRDTAPLRPLARFGIINNRFFNAKSVIVTTLSFNSMQLSCKCYGTSSGAFSVDGMVAFQNDLIEDDSFSKVNIMLQLTVKGNKSRLDKGSIF